MDEKYDMGIGNLLLVSYDWGFPHRSDILARWSVSHRNISMKLDDEQRKWNHWMDSNTTSLNKDFKPKSI